MRYIKKKYRLAIYTIIGDLVKAGIPLFDALSSLEREGENIYDKRFIESISIMKSRIKINSSFSESLSGLVPNNEVLYLKVAEDAGNISLGIKKMADSIVQRDMIFKSLLSSLISPLIMIIISLVVITGYSLNIFPTFEMVLPRTEWPLVTRSLYQFGNSLYNGLWLAILLVFIALIFIINVLAKQLTGSFRNKVIDRLPPFGTIKLLSSTFLLSNIAVLLSSGISFVDSLKTAKYNSNKWHSSHIDKMISNLQEGLEYKKALDTGLFEPNILLFLSIYSSLPDFSATIDILAKKANDNLLLRISKISLVLKNGAFIVLALSVIWIFTGMFALTDKLSSSL